MLSYSFEKSTLSELFKRESVENCLFSVEVDCFNAKRLEDVRKISFLAALDESGVFSFDVIDTAIQYRQIQAEVFIEIPYLFEYPAKDAVSLANSARVNLLLTPPPPGSPKDQWEIWSNLVLEYADAMLNVRAFSKELLPVTSYVQYMTMNVLGYQPEGLTDDPLMKHFFEDGMDIEVMDDLKDKLAQKIIDFHGGDDEFEKLVHGTLAALYDKVDERSHAFAGSYAEWAESLPEESIGSFIVAMLAAIGISSQPFIDLLIDFAKDARLSNVAIIPYLLKLTSPEGRCDIPPMFLEDDDLSENDRNEMSDKTYAFLRKITPV